MFVVMIDRTGPEYECTVTCNACLLVLTTTAAYAIFSGEMVMRPYISPRQWCRGCSVRLTSFTSTAFVPNRMSIRTYRWYRCQYMATKK
jgi:hypothetical protein